MNKRIKKKIEKKRKESIKLLKKWAIKNNIFFIDAESYTNFEGKNSSYNEVKNLKEGSKVLLSNNFNNWKITGIDVKNEFLAYKKRGFIAKIHINNYPCSYCDSLVSVTIPILTSTRVAIGCFWYIDDTLIRKL